MTDAIAASNAIVADRANATRARFYRWMFLTGKLSDAVGGPAPTMPDDVLAALATTGDGQPATEYEGMMD